MAIRGKWNNSAKKNDKNQISSYVSSRPKWLPSTEIWGPWDKYPGRRSCRRNQVTWYKSEQSDWFGIKYHIGILVYREEHWQYCPTDLNPADIASRCTTCTKLVKCPLWWSGPRCFMTDRDERLTFDNAPPSEDATESNSSQTDSNVLLTTSDNSINLNQVINCEYFSNGSKLFCITMLMLTFIKLLK